MDFKKFFRSNKANKVATNFALWIFLVLVQLIHALVVLCTNGDLSNIFLSDFILDWKTAIALCLSGVIFYYVMTKINMKNVMHKNKSQRLIDGELASAAMNLGGALMLFGSTIFLTKHDMAAIFYAGAAFVIYALSYVLLP